MTGPLQGGRFASETSASVPERTWQLYEMLMDEGTPPVARIRAATLLLTQVFGSPKPTPPVRDKSEELEELEKFIEHIHAKARVKFFPLNIRSREAAVQAAEARLNLPSPSYEPYDEAYARYQAKVQAINLEYARNIQAVRAQARPAVPKTTVTLVSLGCEAVRVLEDMQDDESLKHLVRLRAGDLASKFRQSAATSSRSDPQTLAEGQAELQQFRAHMDAVVIVQRPVEALVRREQIVRAVEAGFSPTEWWRVPGTEP